MSFQAAKDLVQRNTYIKEETISSSPLEEENPLLQQYKKQEERYQELLKELQQYQKRKQKWEKEAKKSKEFQKETKLTKKEKERALKVTSIEEIKSLLDNSFDLEKTKQQILTYLYNEAIEYNKIAKENNSSELLAETKKEILQILSLIHWIQAYQKNETIENRSKEETNQNHLIYLTSNSGRIIPLDEIEKNIPIDFYEEIKELLLSIQNGTMKGFKALSGKKFNEVKNRKIRIYFKQINQNTYLILSCFVKDFYTNSKYADDSKRLNAILEAEESTYTTLASSEFYLQEQQNITNFILELLANKRGDNYGRKLK
jgi:hypothetical protein